MIRDDTCRVFLANLSWDAGEDDVRQLAGAHGQVLDVYFPKEYGSDRHKGMCFVGTASSADAKAIVDALEGVEHMGRRLRCEMAKPRGR